MLLVAAGEGAGALAADLAALVEARDPLRGRGADLGLRLDALQRRRPGARRGPRRGAAAAAAGAVRSGRRALRPERRCRSPTPTGSRNGGRASPPRYLLANGKGAALPTGDPLGAAPFLVAADLDGDPREATIRLGLASDGVRPQEVARPAPSPRDRVFLVTPRRRGARPRAPDARRDRPRRPAMARRPARGGGGRARRRDPRARPRRAAVDAGDPAARGARRMAARARCRGPAGLRGARRCSPGSTTGSGPGSRA